MRAGIDNRLRVLIDRYSLKLNSDDLRKRVREIYVKYVRLQQETILDAAATAADLSTEMLRKMDDSRVLEAVSRQYPNLDLDALSSYSDQQLAGIAQGAKGKYFEVLLRDRLNAGAWVGDVHLSEGQEACLTVGSAEPGWDLRILDQDGEVVERLQTKATDYAQRVKEALEANTDIRVITTREVGDMFGRQAPDSGVSDIAHNSTAGRPTKELSESAVGDLLERFNPLLPVGIITLTEGMQVLLGKGTWADAWDRLTDSVSRSDVALGIGALATAFGMGIFSVPVSFFAEIAWDSYGKTSAMARTLQIHTATLREILRAQGAGGSHRLM